MSPEQASGQATDQRADIWAFGVVLYEMLTGLPLFSGESVPHILAAVLQTEPDWNRLPKNFHPRLKLLLERCLEKKVRNRYHSIADVRVDIEKVLSDPHGVTARPISVQPTSRRALPLAAVAVVVTAGIAGLVGWSLRPQTPPQPVQRFSNDFPAGQTLRYPQTPVMAFSRDGRRFVYNTPDGLYVRPLDELEARLIAGTEEQQFTTPVLSPDGQSVAYFALPNELKRIAISCGAALVVANVGPPYGATWEPDGTILYGQSEGIFRVSANGGMPELVIAAGDGERVYGPELLPDGDSVLFSATTGAWDEAQIVAQSLSTGERRVLVNGGSDAHYLPTGHLLYALGDALFGIAFDADRLTVSGEAVPLVQGLMRSTGDVSATANYAVADDGTLLYVSGIAPSGANTLVWTDGKGSEEPLGLPPCNCFDQAVSPDGTRVAVRNGVANGDLWVWSMTQRTFTRLTFEPGTEQAPLWSPNGLRIAYGAPTGLYWRRADGTGTAEPLLEGSGLTPWAWTADGELIFMDGSTGTANIGMLDVTGDHESRLVLVTDFGALRPALSPDGHWLAYQSNESGRSEIYVRPFPDVDSGKWQVSSGGSEEPRWDRDGRTLYFAAPDSLMAVAVESTEPAFTFGTPETVLSLRNYLFVAAFRRYDVSLDGQDFLMAATAAPGDSGETAPRVVIATNWTQELKRLVPAK